MRLIQFLFIFSLVLTVSFETHAQDPAPAAEIANSAVESEPPLESGQSETANPSELRFNFRYAPWQGVLDWFAEQADLSLVMDAPPPGTFNYTDGKPYSPSEAIDLMNSVLLTKGYTLVRREKMLIVVNLQDEIPPVLVETVALDELNDRGEYELVRCIFRVRKVEPGVAAEEIEKLIGPQGRVELLATAKQLMITETAGRLRTIRDVLQAMENPDGEKTEITELTLSHVKAEDAMPVIRQMLGLPEGQNANEAGTVRMTPTEQRILISASEEAIQQVKDVIKLVDLASPNGNGGIAEARQLEIYPIKGADSELALRVMLTVLADSQPPAELSTDPETGKLIALATTAQHATIRATLSQMQQAKQIEVIQLNTVDPQVAVLSINKMLGGGGEEPDENAPIVDADVTTGNLIIRATSEQIADIRSLLEKLGETEDGTGYSYASGTNNVRVLSLGPDAEALLKQAQLVWPLMGKNRIRTVTPSNVMRSAFPKVIERERNLDDAAPLDESDEAGDGSNSYELQPQRNPPVNEEAGHRQNHVTRLAQVTPSNVQADTAEPLPDSADEQDAASAGLQPGEIEQQEGADIIISHGPNGVVIASRDSKALDAFEDLLNLISEGSDTTTSTREFTIFYLMHATPEYAADLLNQLLGNASSADSGGGGDNGLLGDIAGAALGDSGGGLFGSLLGLGGGGSSGGSGFSTSGNVTIVPDSRLNCLYVQANSEDLDLVDQLLKFVDQRKSPVDVATFPAPRLIPVYNTNAQNIQQVVQQVYAEKMSGGGGGGNNQPSPQELIQALRGGGRGGRGGGGGGNQVQQEEQKISISVDTRSNSLVVSAPDQIFEDIRRLVEQLDSNDSGSLETTRIVTLKKANPELVRQTLAAMVGASTSNTASSPSGTAGAPSASPTPRATPSPRATGPTPGQQPNPADFFRAMQQQGGGRGGFGGGGRGGNQDSGGGRGGFGGGGRGGFGGGRGGGGRGN